MFSSGETTVLISIGRLLAHPTKTIIKQKKN